MGSIDNNENIKIESEPSNLITAMHQLMLKQWKIHKKEKEIIKLKSKINRRDYAIAHLSELLEDLDQKHTDLEKKYNGDSDSDDDSD
jgi:acyl carrier protein phosphodiesterase